jgi:hypothetical protein
MTFDLADLGVGVPAYSDGEHDSCLFDLDDRN